MIIDAISDEIERAREHGHKRDNLALYLSRAAFDVTCAELNELTHIKEVRMTWDDLLALRHSSIANFMFEGVKLRAAEFGGGWILLDEKEIFQNLRLSQNFL